MNEQTNQHTIQWVLRGLLKFTMFTYIMHLTQSMYIVLIVDVFFFLFCFYINKFLYALKTINLCFEEACKKTLAVPIA